MGPLLVTVSGNVASIVPSSLPEKSISVLVIFTSAPLISVTVASPVAAVAGSSVWTSAKLSPETVPWFTTSKTSFGNGETTSTSNMIITDAPPAIVPTSMVKEPPRPGVQLVGAGMTELQSSDVFGSTVSSKVKPVASCPPRFSITTVYLIRSPGSAPALPTSSTITSSSLVTTISGAESLVKVQVTVSPASRLIVATLSVVVEAVPPVSLSTHAIVTS